MVLMRREENGVVAAVFEDDVVINHSTGDGWYNRRGIEQQSVVYKNEFRLRHGLLYQLNDTLSEASQMVSDDVTVASESTKDCGNIHALESKLTFATT